MDEKWPSALDERIAAGKADPISEAEKLAAKRLKIAFEERFTKPISEQTKPSAKMSWLDKIKNLLGISSHS